MFKNIKILFKSKTKTIILLICFFCFLSLFFSITFFIIKKTFLFEKKQEYVKTFDASLLNKYYSGKFTLKFTEKNDCQLIETKDFKINPIMINDRQHQVKLFNLGDGQFRDKSDFYTIQTIGKNAFKNNKNIGEVLFIPTTIKKIDDGAFANTKIENIYVKNATNFLPINESVFAGCNIKKIFTRNIKYKKDRNWIKICKNIKFKPYTLDDYEKFLSLRTFSIGIFKFTHNEKTEFSNPISGNCGTGWIVDKVDRNNNDYKYWMATNLHVSHIFEPTLNLDKDDNYFYACSCEEIAGLKISRSEPKFIQQNEKSCFSSLNWKQVAIETKNNNKVYNAKCDINFHNDLKYDHVFTDFSLIKIDFMVDNEIELFYPLEKKRILKEKLKKINNYLLFNNSLNVYAPIAAKNETKFYGVGYPALIDKTGINKSYINYIFQKGKILEFFENKGQHCDFYVVKNYPLEKWRLIQGASGTMMIDENFNVIGIYWGSTANFNYEIDDICRDAFMFIDRFYVKEDNLIAKFLEI